MKQTQSTTEHPTSGAFLLPEENMKASQQGYALIEKWEGLKLKVYKDSAGKDTIGIGHLITNEEKRTGVLSTGVYWRNGITEIEARELLKADVREAVCSVNRLIKVPLSQHQFDALVSFTFNLGSNRLRKSTLCKILNDGDYAGVPKQLMRWVYAGGKKSKGLVNRRRDEAKHWRMADIKPIVKSRTAQGTAAFTAGYVIDMLGQAQVISESAKPLTRAFGEYAQWAGIALTAAGIAYVIYARWDDRRNGIR